MESIYIMVNLAKSTQEIKRNLENWVQQNSIGQLFYVLKVRATDYDVDQENQLRQYYFEETRFLGDVWITIHGNSITVSSTA